VKRIAIRVLGSLLLIFIIFLFFFLPLKTKVVLYTYNPDTQTLKKSESEIETTLAERLIFRDSIYKKVILNLIDESNKNQYYFPIPRGTKLLSLSVKDGIAYVNFSEEFRKNHPGGSLGEILTVYSVVNSLTEFPEIKKVQILIGGAFVETLAGHVDLTSPLEKDLSMVR